MDVEVREYMDFLIVFAVKVIFFIYVYLEKWVVFGVFFLGNKFCL